MDWSEVFGSSGWAWTAVGLFYRLCARLFSAKRTRKKKGPAGASPVASPMPKSVPR